MWTTPLSTPTTPSTPASNPLKDALAIEGSSSAYGNILCVKEGNENLPKILALKAALESKQVADFITEKYAGSVVSTVTNPTDGYDSSIDYPALNGTTVTIAASPPPRRDPGGCQDHPGR
ncbi:MAG: MetQ/NlpA family ABC transporter substrate-binding protein [Oscillospiraceae bacterium]